MEWWEAIILGIVQGITEWLPISSSGHLAIAREGLGLEASTFFDLMLHVGTLLVVVWVFRARIIELTVFVLKFPMMVAKTSFDAAYEHPLRKMATYLVLGSIPIALGGFFFADRVEAAFADLRVVGASLMMTGLLLWSTKKLEGDRSEMTTKDAWFIGLFQMFALLPGVSRSGTTIAAGLHMGLDRETAADFGFLLAVPALIGAVLFKATDATGAAWADANLWLGVFVAAAVGYATLTWLLRFVKEKGLSPFAPYCLVLGLAVLIWAF